MRKILIMLFLGSFALCMTACSDDASGPTTSNSVTADVTTETDTQIADSDGDITPDTEDASPDIEEEEDPKVAIGETCPASCRSLDGGSGLARCLDCEGLYCNFPFQDGSQKYCTKLCNSDLNCRALGEGWSCGDGDVCVK